MKRLIGLMLVLGLAVPVQAWHLFPVREKIVEVQKTNYVLTAGIGLMTFGLGILLSLFIERKVLTYKEPSPNNHNIQTIITLRRQIQDLTQDRAAALVDINSLNSQLEAAQAEVAQLRDIQNTNNEEIQLQTALIIRLRQALEALGFGRE
jgi:hypothetical protein